MTKISLCHLSKGTNVCVHGNEKQTEVCVQDERTTARPVRTVALNKIINVIMVTNLRADCSANAMISRVPYAASN